MVSKHTEGSGDDWGEKAGRKEEKAMFYFLFGAKKHNRTGK